MMPDISDSVFHFYGFASNRVLGREYKIQLKERYPAGASIFNTLTDVYSVTNITEQNKEPSMDINMGGNIPYKSTFSDTCLLQNNMWGTNVRLFSEYIYGNIFLLGKRILVTEVHFTRGQKPNFCFHYSWYTQRTYQPLSL
jgi:hypothetical protein